MGYIGQKNTDITNKVTYIFIVLMVIIFTVETVIMGFIHFYLKHEMSPLAEWLIDSALLTTFLIPMFYFLIYRPFSREILRRKYMEEELKKRINELERFRKTTVEREFRLKELKSQIETSRLERG